MWWKLIAECVPWMVPLVRGSFLRIPRISSSVVQGCHESWPIRNTWYTTTSPCCRQLCSLRFAALAAFNSFSIFSLSSRSNSAAPLFESISSSYAAIRSRSSPMRRSTSACPSGVPEKWARYYSKSINCLFLDCLCWRLHLSFTYATFGNMGDFAFIR